MSGPKTTGPGETVSHRLPAPLAIQPGEIEDANYVNSDGMDFAANTLAGASKNPEDSAPSRCRRAGSGGRPAPPCLHSRPPNRPGTCSIYHHDSDPLQPQGAGGLR